jgi:hypothetical protein
MKVTVAARENQTPDKGGSVVNKPYPGKRQNGGINIGIAF